MGTDAKIGLALGSGSARGWAHIGVIRELTAMGVPIDAVAGCSIGSLVGGVYALGRLDRFEAWVRSLTLRHTALLLIDPHWGSGGILRGERVMKTLRQFEFDALIEELELPFAAVATDMHKGEEIWLKEGSLLEAVRSSAALPGLVKPHFYQDRWMLDGGLVNPVPIALARSLGCEHVIAVNLNHDLLQPVPPQPTTHLLFQWFEESKRWWSSSWSRCSTSQIEPSCCNPPYEQEQEIGHPNYRQVIWSMMAIMQDRITRYRMRLDTPDIEILPQLGHLGFLEFHTAEESIAEGRQAVARQATAIEQLLHVATQRRGQLPAESPSSEAVAELKAQEPLEEELGSKVGIAEQEPGAADSMK